MRTVSRFIHGRLGVARLVPGRLEVFGPLLIVGLLLMPGCQAPQPTGRPEVDQKLVVPDPSELRERLDDFVQFFQATIESTAADIERKSPAKEHRKAAALWRVRMIEECRAIVDQDDSREVFVDLWTLCQRMHDYFTAGDGRAIFGPSQSLAVAASEKINESIEGLVQQFVAKNSLAKLRETVASYSRAHPIRGEFVVAPAERLSDNPEIEKGIGELVALPFAPLKALGAIGRTPESVRDVSKSVYRFSEVLEDLPASARWQLQLLGMNLDESATVSTTVGSFRKLCDSSAQVADNSSRFVQTIDDMPAKVRKETEVLLKTVDESHPHVQTTLNEAQKTATAVQEASQDIRQTVAGVERTVGDVRESAAALEQAANAVTVTAKEILKFVPSTMKDETGQIIGKQAGRPPAASVANLAAYPETMEFAPAPPATTPGEPAVSVAAASNVRLPAKDTAFSFQAVTESATSLGATTEKLRGLLGDLRSFLDEGSLSSATGSLDGQVRGTVDFSAARLQAVVDHAAKRGLQLLLLAFFLLVVYQLGVARFTRPRASR